MREEHEDEAAEQSILHEDRIADVESHGTEVYRVWKTIAPGLGTVGYALTCKTEKHQLSGRRQFENCR